MTSDQSDSEIRSRLELERIKAEIAHLEAATAKADLESSELKRTHQSPWYQPRTLIKVIVGALVAVSILMFYVIEIVVPLYWSDIRDERIRNQELALENLDRKSALQIAEDSLNSQQARFAVAMAKKHQELLDSAEELQEERTLFVRERDSTDRENARELASLIKVQNDLGNALSEARSKRHIDSLTIARLESQTRASLESSIDGLEALRNNSNFPPTKEFAITVRVGQCDPLGGRHDAGRLRELGFTVVTEEWPKPSPGSLDEVHLMSPNYPWDPTIHLFYGPGSDANLVRRSGACSSGS